MTKPIHIVTAHSPSYETKPHTINPIPTAPTLGPTFDIKPSPDSNTKLAEQYEIAENVEKDSSSPPA